MPISNGDAAHGSAMKAEIEDYTKALEVLETYTTRDGLDVDTLIDSDKHGALTYNDFLVLPGYIGKTPPSFCLAVPRAHIFPLRLPCLRCHS
jgi:IMP dehydrogenase